MNRFGNPSDNTALKSGLQVEATNVHLQENYTAKLYINLGGKVNDGLIEAKCFISHLMFHYQANVCLWLLAPEPHGGNVINVTLSALSENTPLLPFALNFFFPLGVH